MKRDKKSKREQRKRSLAIQSRIRTFDDPCLHRVCDPVYGGESLAFVYAMLLALRKSRNGVGLAAPQIGVNKRVIVIWPGRKGDPQVMVNPVVTLAGLSRSTAVEGCLSFPGVSAEVERHDGVKVSWLFNGGACESWFHHFPARVVQHEIDHLDGICRVGEAWRAQKAAGAA